MIYVSEDKLLLEEGAGSPLDNVLQWYYNVHTRAHELCLSYDYGLPLVCVFQELEVRSLHTCYSVLTPLQHIHLEVARN